MKVYIFEHVCSTAVWSSKMAVGVLLICIFDTVWFRLTKSIYSEVLPSDKIEVAPNFMESRLPWCLFAYAILSGSFSASIDTVWPEDAFVLGSTFGFLVFGVFNITTYAINPNWTFPVMVMDTGYGVLIWGFMFYVQHLVAVSDAKCQSLITN